MSRTHHTTHRTEDCRWSVPSIRPKLTSGDEDEFEAYWTCERTRTAVAVTADDCARCPHWAPEPDLAKVHGRHR